MKKYLQFRFQTKDKQIRESLLALLAEVNFDGFEETPEALIAIIEDSFFNQAETETILKMFPDVVPEVSVIEEKNWNDVWESNYDTVIVDDFVQVRASFHEAKPEVKHEIIITPKMSFGTGHHATTYLMMAQMESLDFKNKKVIDFGTGTGVLAILAEKLGAATVYALDNDKWSIENAQENKVVNNCRHIQLALAEALPESGNAHIILANINLNIILKNLKAIKNNLIAGGIVLFSGLLASDKPIIAPAIEEAGFSGLLFFEKNGWLLIKAYANTEAIH